MPLLSDITKKYPKPDNTNYRGLNKVLFEEQNKTCIVIDDDPTGNQTVYDIPLFSDWSVATLKTAFENKTPMFFLLTNSRSMTAAVAKTFYTNIKRNILMASQATGREYVIVSRSDSTLRGHFKAELEALADNDNSDEVITFFIPVMFEGGRVTANGIHYLTEGEALVPVGETAFAKDASFGYQSSDLGHWVEEKTEGEIPASSVMTFDLETIRNVEVSSLAKSVLDLPSGALAICDALEYHDLDKMLHAILLAEKSGKKIRYRTSSSFLPSYIGQEAKPLLSASSLNLKTGRGGLIVVGSYVKKSSQQLAYLLANSLKEEIYELDVEAVVNGMEDQKFGEISKILDNMLLSQKKVILYTSRKLITGDSTTKNLEIGAKISSALVNIVKNLKTNPRYILAKGGITSHDLAVNALQMKSGLVLGQILPGIPVWQLMGNQAFADTPYIVFPGNVGQESSIFEITEKLKSL